MGWRVPSVSDGHTYNCYGRFDVFPSLANVNIVHQKLAHASGCYIFIAAEVGNLQVLCLCRLPNSYNVKVHKLMKALVKCLTVVNGHCIDIFLEVTIIQIRLLLNHNRLKKPEC